MKVDNFTNFEWVTSRFLRWFGRQTPSIRYLRAIPNRLLKPLHLAFGFQGGVVDVLGFKMKLEPRECVDGNLWFAPQLYDKAEIVFLKNKMPKDGVFVDIGANIGFWSLCFSYVFPMAKIYAIEANPGTFEVLCGNIAINNFRNITPLNVGVSDDVGELPLYCNDTGNRGGDSFANYADNRKRCVMVRVEPLAEILVKSDIKKIDVMKMDIEGFEERVLTRFFSEAPRGLWPHFICAEITHVPKVMFLLQHMGYRLALSARENCVFELDAK